MQVPRKRNRFGGKDYVVLIGHVETELPLRHQKGVMSNETLALEFRGVLWAESVYVILRFQQFKVILCQ